MDPAESDAQDSRADCKWLNLQRLAPQAGFEPATLRLTGGKNEISRALPPFAGLCRTLRPPLKNLAVFRFRLMPAFAALCCCQRARRGQRPNSNPQGDP